MVDYEKQRKFEALGEELKKRLESRYKHEFQFYQHSNANAFEVYSKRPADPYFELTFTNDEKLAVAVSDSTHVPPFVAAVSLSHCVIFRREPDYGWRFDTEAIWSVVERLFDLGVPLYTDNQQERVYE